MQLRVQESLRNLTDKIEMFTKQLQKERERFLHELSDIEGWLEEVYGTLRKEPNRGFLPCHSFEEVEALWEEYGTERVIVDGDPETYACAADGGDEGVNVGLESGEEGVNAGLEGGEGGVNGSEGGKDGVIGLAGSERWVNGASTDAASSDEVDRGQTPKRRVFNFPQGVRTSGSSLGSEILEMGGDHEPLDQSVDVELEDDEYQERVLSKVLSDSSASPSPSASPTTGSARFDEFDSSVDPVGQYFAEDMEETAPDEAPVDTVSVSSESTLKGEGPRSQGQSAEFEEEEEKEASVEGVKVGAEEVKEKSDTIGRSLADELAELGMELEQESSDKEVNEPESGGERVIEQELSDKEVSGSEEEGHDGDVESEG